MNPITELRPAGYDDGLKAAGHVEQPACPFKPESPSWKAWHDGLIDGNTNIAWNVRSVIMAGQAGRWLSEAVSMELGITVGKSIIPLGAEMLCHFRLGFAINDRNVQIPVLTIDEWKRYANTVQNTLRGQPLDPAGNPSNLECLGWEIARTFVETVLDGTPAPPPDEKNRNPRFDVDMRKLLAWMGAPSGDLNIRI